MSSKENVALNLYVESYVDIIDSLMKDKWVSLGFFMRGLFMANMDPSSSCLRG